MSRQILAIDIRQDTVEAVLLNTGLKLSTLVDCASVSLPAPSENSDALVEALKELKAKIDPGTANVMVAMPSDGVLYRKLKVPFKEDGKIRQVLPFELEPLLPVGVDDLKFDFHKNQVGDGTEILAMAIDQTTVQRYMDALNSAGFRPQLIVPGSFPLAIFLTSLDEFASEQMLILDVGHNKTTLYAMASGKIERIRRLSSQVDSEQSAEALALRIRQTLTAMSDHPNDLFTPTRVFVTGPGIDDPEASSRLSLALELPTVNIDLSQWAPRMEMDDDAIWVPGHMNNALALALTEIDGRPCANFHRISSPLRNYWNAYRPYIIGPVVLLGIALFLGLSGVIVDNYLLSQRVNKLDAQLEKVYLSVFPDSRVNAPPLDLMLSKIKELKKGTATSGQSPVSLRTIDVMLQVSELIPPTVDVLLTRMTVAADSLTLTGETAAFNTVDDVKSRLEKGDLFKRVTIASANTGKSGKKVRFKLKIDL